MNIGDMVLSQFYDGTLDATSFLLMELQRNSTRLTKFLHREFTKKRIRVNVTKLKEHGKCPIAYGSRNEWWLVEAAKFPRDTLEKTIKASTVRIDYVLPLASKTLYLVAIKRDNEKKETLNEVSGREVIQDERPKDNTGNG